MSDQVEALAGMLKRIPPPIRTATAQEMAAAGVRHQPDAPPVDDIDRLRQIDASEDCSSGFPARRAC